MRILFLLRVLAESFVAIKAAWQLLQNVLYQVTFPIHPHLLYNPSIVPANTVLYVRLSSPHSCFRTLRISHLHPSHHQ